ncbi:MAG: hypothetical protein IPK60_25705 [Sandaracinaceae bacterium]|nr:hypothetical protein [Sandaracinaceae bacterium]
MEAPILGAGPITAACTTRGYEASLERQRIDSVSSTGFVASGVQHHAPMTQLAYLFSAPDGTWRTLGVVLDSDFVSHSSGVILCAEHCVYRVKLGST